MKTPIIDGLEKYINDENYPWHMPGHKRKAGNIKELDGNKRSMSENCTDGRCIDRILDMARKMDVTEVPGTDDLHHPEEMIKESMEELKLLYGSYSSYYLVNGSTSGILSALMACGKNGVIAASNCHKSVHHGIALLKVEADYIEPEWKKTINCDISSDHNCKMSCDIKGVITPEALEQACQKNEKAGAVIITSPTYEGVISDIKALSAIAHRYGKVLIVDEAHGAHLPFMKKELSAVNMGADIVIESLHKTLEAFTQTAIIHVMKQELDSEVRRYISYFVSSSPSYILLCSMEAAVKRASEMDYSEYKSRLANFREKTRKLNNIEVLSREKAISMGAYDYDETRIVIRLAKKDRDKDDKKIDVTGVMLEKMLYEQGHIVSEMSGIDYVVLISTYVDSREDFDRLYSTIIKVDSLLDSIDGETYNIIDCNKENVIKQFEYIKTIENELIDIVKTEAGIIAVEDIYVYPPGVPIVRRGESIKLEDIERMKIYLYAGKELRGLEYLKRID